MSHPGTRRARRRGEEGAATVVVCALLGVLLLVAGACGVVAAAFADHRRAQAAADLAALSGATVHQRGEDACGEAAAVAVANGAHLLACRVEGYDVLVAAEVTGPRWLGFTGDPVAHARAGPEQ
ncbi:Rv3654c family TadE-like protein [Nocardioides sp. CFH 31398]|uniref:Rv3654c family TadE-like protein n=1 Tax=Nocardioides sp. CFH 31398 TaxID=2919579 RepID=UPI001F05A325|nr:Rv3654c family TadE-like protein [Nocardioides sp. CFH 31398]MCH1867756.1 flp pilus-assembly TadE/G-like family protein [Nocardioides sp. CFH 31398]